MSKPLRDAKGRFVAKSTPAPARRPVQVSVRNYVAGAIDRLTNDWYSGSMTANEAIEGRFRTIRNRARDLERNNALVRRFLQMVASNVFGPHGIRMQSEATEPDGRPDNFARTAVERWWKEWGRVGVCTLDGRLGWPEVEAMLLRRVLVDGEALLELVPGANNGHGFAVRVLDADLLDESLNQDLGNGRRVRAGVEIEEATERPIAYHMLTDVDKRYGSHRVRVAADRILHLYFQERPHQYRGVTWLASTMERGRMLDGFEQAAVVAARVGAGKMGFLKPDAESGYTGEGKDPDGWTRTSAEPGSIEELPMGMEFQAWDPAYPNTDFEAFSQEIKRGIASGLGVSYVGLANDLEGVSYSSIRQGELADRDYWRSLQQYCIRHISERVFPEALRMGLTMGMVGNLPVAKFDKFAAVRWMGRGWEWVDPLKEIQAAEHAVRLGVQSRMDIAAGKGLDLEEILKRIKLEQDLAAELGVDIGGIKATQQQPIAENV